MGGTLPGRSLIRDSAADWRSQSGCTCTQGREYRQREQLLDGRRARDRDQGRSGVRTRSAPSSHTNPDPLSQTSRRLPPRRHLNIRWRRYGESGVDLGRHKSVCPSPPVIDRFFLGTRSARNAKNEGGPELWRRSNARRRDGHIWRCFTVGDRAVCRSGVLNWMAEAILKLFHPFIYFCPLKSKPTTGLRSYQYTEQETVQWAPTTSVTRRRTSSAGCFRL